MAVSMPSTHLAEALARAGQHDLARRLEAITADSRLAPFTALTIAISRQVGARGTSVGRAVAKLLDWQVYDQELIHRIAHEMHVPSDQVAGVDEKPISWLQECIQAFSTAPHVTEEAYVHHLLETLFLLGAQGECVLVGRGSAHALPEATTLRVRLIAHLEDRIEVMRRELGVTRSEAARYVVKTDRERAKFIRDHFFKDPNDAENYDLVLNSSRFSVEECAGVIVEALRRM